MKLDPRLKPWDEKMCRNLGEGDNVKDMNVSIKEVECCD